MKKDGFTNRIVEFYLVFYGSDLIKEDPNEQVDEVDEHDSQEVKEYYKINLLRSEGDYDVEERLVLLYCTLYYRPCHQP